MMAYEQSLKLFGRWCMEEMGIFTVDKFTENDIRRYIIELQERGKYTFYTNDKQKNQLPRAAQRLPPVCQHCNDQQLYLT